VTIEAGKLLEWLCRRQWKTPQRPKESGGSNGPIQKKRLRWEWAHHGCAPGLLSQAFLNGLNRDPSMVYSYIDRGRPSPGRMTMINVSETAASKINELLSEENKAGSGLRVFVQGGGCSGFQ